MAELRLDECPLCGDAFCLGPIVRSGPAGRIISVQPGCEVSPERWRRLWDAYAWVPPTREDDPPD